MPAKKDAENKEPDALTQQPTDITPVAAPEGATLKGLADEDEIEIIHPDTGQTYGVSVKAYNDLYKPAGFQPTRKGDNTLLPGDERAPKDVPADNPAIVVETPEATEPEE